MLSTCGAVRVLAAEIPLAFGQQRNIGRRAPKQGKPPVLPPAKKVLYHVVHVPWQKPEDVRELLWRRHVYNNAVTSLREVFRAELQEKARAGQGLEAMRAAEEEELDTLIAENERVNRQMATSRTERDKEEWKETQQEILGEIGEALEKQKALSEQAAQEVRAAIDRSKEFVTKENLQSKILAALENPMVYDFCIDKQGNKMYSNTPVKYQEGTPTRQKGRIYDKTLAPAELEHKRAVSS